MATQQISDGHLRALHTLFGIYAARALDLTSSDLRQQRLKWAAQNIGREITSFRDLTDAEAGSLVDLLKVAVGQEVSAPVRRRSRRPRSRQGAEACGLEGRQGDERPVSIATAEDLAPIDEMRQRLGWSREAFDGWLRSPSSPLKSSTALRTLADCNRVRWALKQMLKRAGLWTPSAKRNRRAA
ncbi:MAG: hypothetical protein LAO06_02590 [Acidobacteriia bacterium]|nr:hypothetical protein [Terriglobia bacterium]